MKALTLLLIVSSLGAQEDLQNPEYLRRVVTSLAAQNRPADIYLFLENEFPEFSRLLQRSSLADYLDGRLATGDFESAWRSEAGSSQDDLYRAFREGMTYRPADPPPQDRSVDSLLRERGGSDPVAALRSRLYEAEGHPLRKAEWVWMREVAMAEIPGELWWFNETLSIPELGIKPGVPLTKAQKFAVVRLFSVRVANEALENPVVGTANYPADVGRSVNVRGDRLTVINGENGEIFPDLTLKGIGVTPKTPEQRLWTSFGPTRHGHFTAPKAVLEAEVGKELQLLGVRGHVPVAIIRDRQDPSRTIHIRAQPGIARVDPHLLRERWWSQPSLAIYDTAHLQYQNSPKSDASLRTVLDYLAANAGLTTGVGRPLTIPEYVGEFVPRIQGRNAGIIAEVGFHHTNHLGNAGPADLMDFGEAQTTQGRWEPSVKLHRGVVEYLVQSTNAILPKEQAIDPAGALTLYDRSVEEGREIGRKAPRGILLSDRWASALDEKHLGEVLRGYGYRVSEIARSGDPQAREILLREFRAAGRSLSTESTVPNELLADLLAQTGTRPDLQWLAESTDPETHDLLVRETRRIASEFRLGIPKNPDDAAKWVLSSPDYVRNRKIWDSPDPEVRELLMQEVRRRNLPLHTEADIPLEWLAKELGYASKSGDKLAFLRAIGKTKDTSVYEALLERPVAELRQKAREQGVEHPERLNKAQLARALSDPVPQHRGSWLRNEAAGAGKFAAAYLLKEAFKGRNAVDDLKTLGFWGSLAVFTVAARGAEKALPFKKILPLAAGMAAVQFLSGNYSLKDLAVSTGSFLAAGAAVNLLLDGGIFPVLFAAGPPGRIAAGMYTIGKLAVTLYAGEKLEAWIHSLLEERKKVSTHHEGVMQKIDRIPP